MNQNNYVEWKKQEFFLSTYYMISFIQLYKNGN